MLGAALPSFHSTFVCSASGRLDTFGWLHHVGESAHCTVHAPLTQANRDLSGGCPPSTQQLDVKCTGCRAAFVLGCIAGGVYIGCSRALLWLRIDDPLDASAVHAGCAIVGLLGERGSSDC